MTPISDLIKRLKAAGVDEGFVRAWMLPDWWEDEVANNASGMAMAEMYIARMTGLSIKVLRDGSSLTLTPEVPIRFKKRADTDIKEAHPAAAIAEQIAKSLVAAVKPLPAFAGKQAAIELRKRVLATSRTVSLKSLVDFAWDSGIIVGHIAELPKGSKKVDGLAMVVHGRPVVLLASGRDSPPWLAFHLAHELGHVLCGHVSEGKPISDVSIDERSEDPEEIEANEYALAALTGDSKISFTPKPWRGTYLAQVVQSQGPSKGIDPGVLALIYGWSADRIPAAQVALNHLKLGGGAHEIIADGLRRHLQEELPESIQMLIDLVIEA